MDNLDSVFSTSPLGDIAALGNAESVQLSVLPFCIKLNLRGNAADSAWQTVVKDTTGLLLPTEPNTFTSDAATSLFWLGPDEWQWRHKNATSAEPESVLISTLVSDFESRTAGIHSSVVDVSDYYTVLELRGPNTFAVLEKGSPLHLRQALETASTCAQTRFGNAALLLNREESDDLVLHIQVRWSYAEYTWQYLAEAMQEYN